MMARTMAVVPCSPLLKPALAILACALLTPVYGGQTVSSSGPGKDQGIALTGGTLVDLSDYGRSKNDLSDAAVVLRGGRIVAAGPRARVQIPGHARVIDVSGKFILPGFVDGFASLDSQAQANAYLYMGVTSVVASHDDRRPSLIKNAQPGPHIYMMDSAGTTDDYSLLRTDPRWTTKLKESEEPAELTPEDTRRQLRETARLGTKVIWVGHNITANNVQLIVAEAHRLGMIAYGEFDATPYAKALDDGIDVLMHMSRYEFGLIPDELQRPLVKDPEGPAMSAAYRYIYNLDPASPKVREFARQIAAHRVALLPTLSGFYTRLPDHRNLWKEPVATILDPKRMFIAYTDIGLFRSENAGESWASATLGLPNDWVNTTYWIMFDPEVKGRVWGAMSYTHDLPRPKMWRRASPTSYRGGVAISDDGGRTWSPSNQGMPQTAATHILLDPTSPVHQRVLYITGFGRGVFKSTDGGKTWIMKNKGLADPQPFAWRLARDMKGTLYLVVARRSEDGSFGNASDGALYRSRNGAEHWERIPLPPGVNGANGIAIDQENPQRLYLAVWGRNTPRGAVDGGIYISEDGGRSWRNVLARDQHVYDITGDPRDSHTLYACGFESSAWCSHDRGETWQRIRGFNFKWGHRVVPDPQHSGMIYITTFGGSVWYGPAAGDPAAVEDIVTPVLAYGK